MKVLLDTSGWYATAIEKDEKHPEAKKFLTKEIDLIVLFTVFEEIMALFQNRFGKRMAVQNGQALKEMGLAYPSEGEMENCWRLFNRSPSKISFVDSTVIWAAQKMHLPVFGFDDYFRKLGITILPA